MLSGGCKYNKALIMKQRNSLAVHWLGFTALIARGWIQSLVREPGFCKQLDAVSVCVCVCVCMCVYLLLFNRSVMSDSLQPHGLQHSRLPCPSLPPGACSNSCPFSQ